MIPSPPQVLEFRDGEHVVPDHVAKLIAMAGIDPVAYTYEEAVELTNNTLARNYAEEARQKMISAHLGGRVF